jgi:hypothetical protein
MRLLSIFILLIGFTVQAGTSSHFTPGGDRVLINLYSGRAGVESEDQDSIRLFDSIVQTPGRTLIGSRQTKKVQMQSALRLVLNKNTSGRVDGTLMIYRWPGVRIDSSRREVKVRWSGSRAASLYEKFQHPNGEFKFESIDGRLRILSQPTAFYLEFSEWG